MDPRLDLIRHYRWLRQYGLNDSHSGNASVRCGEDYWVTPTGACADTLEADALIRCPLDGKPAAGDGILQRRPLGRLHRRRHADRRILRGDRGGGADGHGHATQRRVWLYLRQRDGRDREMGRAKHIAAGGEGALTGRGREDDRAAVTHGGPDPC